MISIASEDGRSPGARLERDGVAVGEEVVRVGAGIGVGSSGRVGRATPDLLVQGSPARNVEDLESPTDGEDRECEGLRRLEVGDVAEVGPPVRVDRRGVDGSVHRWVHIVAAAEDQAVESFERPLGIVDRGDVADECRPSTRPLDPIEVVGVDGVEIISWMDPGRQGAAPRRDRDHELSMSRTTRGMPKHSRCHRPCSYCSSWEQEA